jgi:uncharacterized DUF497 family protein
MTLQFAWDEKNNAANRRKHGVSFAEAKTAFLDDNARVVPDPEHSDDEERFVLLGLSISLRVLVVYRIESDDFPFHELTTRLTCGGARGDAFSGA